jgi:hypothetical protein
MKYVLLLQGCLTVCFNTKILESLRTEQFGNFMYCHLLFYCSLVYVLAIWYIMYFPFRECCVMKNLATMIRCSIICDSFNLKLCIRVI